MKLVTAQAAYVAKHIERAAAVGHQVTITSEPRPGRPGKLQFYAGCSCGWLPVKRGSISSIFVQVCVHVGVVSPLSDSEIREGEKIGLMLPPNVVSV